MGIKFTILFGEEGRLFKRRILENWAQIGGIFDLEKVKGQEHEESSEQQRKPCSS